jgi:DNA-binding CsgD family transcriptional regulator
MFLDLGAGRAWSLLATGDRRACITELAAVEDRSAELGHVPYHAMALHDAVRLGATVYDRLEEVLGDVQSRWAAPMSAHNRGRRAGDVELLEEGATGFEAMGADLLAAECWATTARVAAGRGLGARARRASARSSRLAAACGGVWTPALGLPDVLPELTARELQVARRASSGATSREIAEGLGISVRTVDNLLGRAYTKLGISRRDELLSVLPDQ